MGMKRKEDIVPCQGYRGRADMERVEYKYPLKRTVSMRCETCWAWLGSKWNESFFPGIETAIALNEVNYL